MLLKNAFYLDENLNAVQGNLVIKEGKIVIGEHAGYDEKNIETVDCEGYIIIPGLYNSHFHGYSLLAKGLAKDIKIQDWCNDSLQGKIQADFFGKLDHLPSDEYRTVLMKAYVEMIKKGIVFASESEPGNWPDVIAETMENVGLRGLVDSHEKIADFYGKEVGRVSYGTHLLEEEDITDEALSDCERIKKSFDSIHLAHCMENGWRKDLIFAKYGKSSVALYQERNLLDDKTVLFHGVHLNEDDIGKLAVKGASVVHCPVSNFWSGAGVAPVAKMLDKGVNVCIGTDYASVDIWETMKVAYYLLKNNPSASSFTAEDVLKMATRNGAGAYRQNSAGSIQNGFSADLVFIKKDPFIPDILSGGFSTVVHNLLMETQEEQIHHVMIGGKWIMFNRKILTVDEEKLNTDYLRIVDKIYK
ncbi:amidohydrolase family protein [Peribacillus glennii]|uniref:Amidohydrolase-related domain-containing protein n=1 Tax=Peribacillus glennii TaxID=2303991 RepID=A0A372LAN5_9BACI|nr:amidohydrolase family protein [Peribacillus glennii]RFU62833.1 hypothetical protein D0466_12810 [Peribacillus glennii]